MNYGFNKIAVVGLGLIGGSMAKTVSKRTDCRVYGFNRNQAVSKKAKEEGALYGIIEEDADFDEMDFIILGLYPDACIEFVKSHIAELKKGAVIVDCCGTKQKICDALYELCKQNGLYFVGGHPMAGIEKSGYDYSFDGLFDNASMILCKLNQSTGDSYDSAYDEVYKKLKEFFLKIGFGYVKESTPAEHDRVIAYTSQMAHVVSSAYIKSEACKTRYGFSAGSFKDMTRVAFLNETMWTELFLENRDCLLREMEEFMEHMKEYHDALENRNEEELCKLLKEGRLCKSADIQGEEEQQKRQQQEKKEQ
ncbi:MAG: prephenate dehydrogenase/arogenate dehydrogenase family protein [Lachnospiraceae bacterium]|nr:prephenate dehydrogenase/arogenate dehydrogenase family protein [Lachnospiraceae bacterium]